MCLDVWDGVLPDPSYGVLPHIDLLHASGMMLKYYDISLTKSIPVTVFIELANDADLLADLSSLASDLEAASSPAEMLLIAGAARQTSDRLNSYRHRLFPTINWAPPPPAPDPADQPVLAQCLAPHAQAIVSLRSVYSRYLNGEVYSAARSLGSAATEAIRTIITILDIALLAVNSTHKLSSDGLTRLYALLSDEAICRGWEELAVASSAFSQPADLAQVLDDHLPLLRDLASRHRLIVGAARIR